MHIETDYEKLVKEGYIEEGTLVIHVDDLSKMEITSRVHEEMKPEGVVSERHDKSVVVVDNQGRRKRVSHLAFGKNKHGVQLSDGSFMSAEDLLVAMEEAVSKLEPGTVVVDRKGRFSTPEELLQIVKQTAGKIIVGKVPEGIKNHGRLVAVVGANSEKVHRKGTMIMGTKDFDLDEGEYVNLEELMKALEDYVIMSKEKKPVFPIPPIPPKTITEEDPVVVRVVKKHKNQLSKRLILLAIIAVLASGFRITDKTKMIEVPIEYQQQIMRLVERDNLQYRIQGMEYEDVLETLQDSAKRYVLELDTGDTIRLEEGDVLYENSALGGKKAIIGNSLRAEGDYAITGVSIVYEGDVFAYYVDLAGDEAAIQIGDYVNDICTKHNLDYSKVEIRLHFGGTKDNTQIGWIDISELFQEDELEREVVGKVAVEGSSYEGEVQDFEGTIISFATLDGPVTLKITDFNGNLLEPGTTVIGSDGKEYVITELNLESYQKQEREMITGTRMELQEVSDGKKLTWRIQDCNLTIAIAPLLGALAAHVATKKKNEEEEKNPNFFEFENEAEYQRFKKEFEEAKEKYERTSGFKKMLKDVFYRKEVDLLQRLTEEQIKQLYAAIRNHHSGDYSYNPSDKIEFRNGRIIITFSDGRTQDITDIVMPSISMIGKENKPETEGLLEEMEEQKDGVRRR